MYHMPLYIISNSYGYEVSFNSVTLESGTRMSFNFLYPLQHSISTILGGKGKRDHISLNLGVYMFIMYSAL